MGHHLARGAPAFLQRADGIFPSQSFGNAQDPPKSQTTGQSHQPVLVTNPLSLVPKDGAELPRMLGGAASSQSWEQDGITVWLGDVDLMGLVMWI